MRSNARRLRFIALATVLVAGAVAAKGDPAADEPRLHLLYLNNEGFRLEPLRLRNGESRTFVIDRQSELVEVVYPVGTGTSGNVIQRSKDSYTVTVRRDGDTYHSTTRTASGRTVPFPPLAIADLRTYRVRLDVTAADGRKQAFEIDRGLQVRRLDDGPVIDMFQGAVPLGPQDLSITTRTETLAAEDASPSVAGQAAVTYDKGLLFTGATIADRSDLELIVDFAAGATVVARSVLPAGVEIRTVAGTEYSAGGARQIEPTMKGAGGDVSGYLGVATLAELTVGDLVFRDVRVSVLSDMPEFGGHHPDGILGIDLLSRAAVASVRYGGPGQRGQLRLSDKSHVSTTEVVEIPFSRVLDHILVRGTVDGAPVDLVFDTGARRTHLHPDVARAAHLALRPDDDPEGSRGLDGAKIETRLASAHALRLGSTSFPDVTFVVADLPVFHTMGLGDDAGLLGNTFLERFSEVEVDFDHERVRLVP